MARKPRAHPGASGVADSNDGNTGGNDPIANVAIDPADLGTGGGGFEDDGPDDIGGADYQRDADGTIKRNADGSPRKKRGRKAGSTSKPRTRVHDLKSSIDSLTSMLGVFHMGIAAATSSPEMMLTEGEAKELATAAVPVLDQFDWMPDPRYAAIGGLLIVCGKIYIPRVVAIRSRPKAPKQQRPMATPQPMAQPMQQNDSGFTANGFADFGDITKVN